MVLRRSVGVRVSRMARVVVGLPDDLAHELDTVAAGLHSSRSAVVCRAVEPYLNRLACERDADVYERQPLSASELALTDHPEAWAATPSW